MKIKILKPCEIPDKGHLEPGDVVDVNSEYDRFVYSGFAEFVDVKAAPVQTRDPVVETRDPLVESGKPKKQK